MALSSALDCTISATALADRLARGERMIVVDLRGDEGWGIEAPNLVPRRLSPAAVLADPAAVARELTGLVAVVCHRGRTAGPVVEALRGQGVDAVGARDMQAPAWIGALQSRPVDPRSRGTVRATDPTPRPRLPVLSVRPTGGHALVVDPAPDVGFYLGLAEEPEISEDHRCLGHPPACRSPLRGSDAQRADRSDVAAAGAHLGARRRPTPQDVEPLHDGYVMTCSATITLRTNLLCRATRPT